MEARLIIFLITALPDVLASNDYLWIIDNCTVCFHFCCIVKSEDCGPSAKVCYFLFWLLLSKILFLPFLLFYSREVNKAKYKLKTQKLQNISALKSRQTPQNFVE